MGFARILLKLWVFGQPSVHSPSAENRCSNHPAALGFVCPVCGGMLEDIKLKRICSLAER